MAQRPTREETIERCRAKLARHPFVPVSGSRLCGHVYTVVDPMVVGVLMASAMTGYRGPGSDVGVEKRRCNRPRRVHIDTSDGTS